MSLVYTSSQVPIFVPKHYPPNSTAMGPGGQPQFTKFWQGTDLLNYTQNGYQSSEDNKADGQIKKAGQVNGSSKRYGQGKAKRGTGKQNGKIPRASGFEDSFPSLGPYESAPSKLNSDANANDPNFRSFACHSPTNFSEASSSTSKRSNNAKSIRSRTMSGSTSTSIDIRQIPSPPSNSIQFHPSRWKTELCRQYEEMGTCEYGARCLFAHGKHELRDLPNRHPKFKTQICNSYNVQGFCSFGPRCSFIHSKPDPQSLLKELQEKSTAAKQPMPENVNVVDIVDDEWIKKSDKDLQRGLLHPDSFFLNPDILPTRFDDRSHKRLNTFIQITDPTSKTQDCPITSNENMVSGHDFLATWGQKGLFLL